MRAYKLTFVHVIIKFERVKIGFERVTDLHIYQKYGDRSNDPLLYFYYLLIAMAN